MAACNLACLAAPSMLSVSLGRDPCAVNVSSGRDVSFLPLIGVLVGRRNRGVGEGKVSNRSIQAFAAPAGSPGAQDPGEARKIDVGRGPERRQQVGRRSPTRSLSPFDLVDSLFPTTRSLRSLLDVVGALDEPYYATARPARAQQEKQPSQSSMRTPWDVIEEDDAFFLRIDIPGYSKEQVRVYVEEGSLVIKAEQSQEDKTDKFATRNFANVSSRLLLPDNADLGSISAELKNGVLVVTVPKLTKPKNGILDIRVN